MEEEQAGAHHGAERMEGMGMIVQIFTAIGVYTVVMCFVRIVLALMGDRTGNSGRYKMWDQDDD